MGMFDKTPINFDEGEEINSVVTKEVGTQETALMQVSKWTKLAKFWTQDVSLPLSPKAQKVKKEFHDFWHMEITKEDVHDFFSHEITLKGIKDFWFQDIDITL